MSYVLIIVLGYVLKRVGFFKKEDRQVLSSVMLYITMPCAIIQGFSGFERDAQLFWLVGIGFVLALLPMLWSYVTTRGMQKDVRVYRMLNSGGYNVGCFSLPLLQAFFGSACVVPVCMFDTGNAVMMTGGAYAMTSTLLKTGGEKRESAKEIALKFLSSAPFDTYMVLFALTALNIAIPQAVFTLTQPAGQANGFLAMLIIGLMFEPAGDRKLIAEAARVLTQRYAFAALTAMACYFLTPFDLGVRQTLCVLCFAPLSSLSPIYTARCGGSAELAGFTNSISIAVSLMCMLLLSLVFVA